MRYPYEHTFYNSSHDPEMIQGALRGIDISLIRLRTRLSFSISQSLISTLFVWEVMTHVIVMPLAITKKQEGKSYTYL